MWQGLQTITDYTGKPSHKLSSESSLPDELNAFFARFEESNDEPYVRAPAIPDDCVITLSVADVSKTFKQVNIHMAGRAIRITRTRSQHTLNSWQVSDIFNLFLAQSVIPTYFKQTTLVPVPKNAKITCLNDYRPIAHTCSCEML
jgi:gmma-aminobutyric acid receptor subunit gamma/cGMP-dependent protein kinase 2